MEAISVNQVCHIDWNSFDRETSDNSADCITGAFVAFGATVRSGLALFAKSVDVAALTID
ncbi:hypothetical protein RBSH_02651 [Rhodopirellula baltica SH28]|uniref:Uncharacterized protein n=1 Tax=Rhodopirellula baltica SH28 TaxID=993517 RepID=K5DI33_RHOBT|nr:hypothetical protein RBSH_02651 [Rhodopirellula baltica SH28]